MSAMATHFSLRLLPFLLLLLPVLSNAQPQQVIYSWPMSMLGDARGSYPIALLHLAIEKSGTEYKLVPNGQVMSQHRTLRQLGRIAQFILRVVLKMGDRSLQQASPHIFNVLRC